MLEATSSLPLSSASSSSASSDSSLDSMVLEPGEVEDVLRATEGLLAEKAVPDRIMQEDLTTTPRRWRNTLSRTIGLENLNMNPNIAVNAPPQNSTQIQEEVEDLRQCLENYQASGIQGQTSHYYQSSTKEISRPKATYNPRNAGVKLSGIKKILKILGSIPGALPKESEASPDTESENSAADAHDLRISKFVEVMKERRHYPLPAFIIPEWDIPHRHDSLQVCPSPLVYAILAKLSGLVKFLLENTNYASSNPRGSSDFSGI